MFLFPHAVPFARLMTRMTPDFFREDFELLVEISEVRDLGTMRQELSRFYGRNLRDKDWVRRNFQIRISGQRVIAFCNQISSE